MIADVSILNVGLFFSGTPYLDEHLDLEVDLCVIPGVYIIMMGRHTMPSTLFFSHSGWQPTSRAGSR